MWIIRQLYLLSALISGSVANLIRNYCVYTDVPVQTMLLIDKKDKETWHKCVISHFLEDLLGGTHCGD